MNYSRRNFIRTTSLSASAIIAAPYTFSQKYRNDMSMQSSTDLPFRQVHLDFHTSKDIEGIGANFNALEFVETLKKAKVNSITCFGRCHHGLMYYNSKKFPERVHPHLQEPRLLEKQIEACHSNNIRVPVYLTIQIDHYTAMHHPEWHVRGLDGKVTGVTYTDPGFYRKLCLNSPYRDFLKDSIVDLFECVNEVDGLFLDILSPTECFCMHCRKKMREQELELSNPQHRWQLAVETIEEFKNDMSAFIRQIEPDTDIFYNSGHIGPYIKDTIDDYSHLEMESLPSGQWGYIHFPLTARYVRTLNKDFLGMTGKFHTAWGDFYSYKNKPALEFECFMMLALGAKCSIGDQLPPDGKLDQTTYDLIGSVYNQVAEKEKWCINTTPVVDIAIITPEALNPSGSSARHTPQSIKGALRMLQEAGKQFNIIDFEQDFNPYKLIILPDEIVLTSSQANKFKNYINNGGKVIASFESGLDEKKLSFMIPLGVEKTSDGPVDVNGNKAVGRIYPRFDYAEYILPEDNVIGKGLPKSDHVMYIKGLPIETTGEGNVMANTIKSYFDRTYKHFCSHRQTPSSSEVSHPGIVATKNTVYFSHPVCTKYQYNAPKWCKTLFINAVESLLEDPVVKLTAPSTTICTVNRQKDNYIVHLLHYIPERRGEQFDTIEDVIPLSNIRLSLAFPKKARKVQLVPEMKALDFKTMNGRIEFTVPRVIGHQMIEVR